MAEAEENIEQGGNLIVIDSATAESDSGPNAEANTENVGTVATLFSLPSASTMTSTSEVEVRKEWKERYPVEETMDDGQEQVEVTVTGRGPIISSRKASLRRVYSRPKNCAAATASQLDANIGGSDSDIITGSETDTNHDEDGIDHIEAVRRDDSVPAPGGPGVSTNSSNVDKAKPATVTSPPRPPSSSELQSDTEKRQAPSPPPVPIEATASQAENIHPSILRWRKRALKNKLYYPRSNIPAPRGDIFQDSTSSSDDDADEVGVGGGAGGDATSAAGETHEESPVIKKAKLMATKRGDQHQAQAPIENDHAHVPVKNIRNDDHEETEPFKCEPCSRFFTSQKGLNVHKAQVHPVPGQKKFACALCPNKYCRIDALKVHMKKHHADAPQCEFCEKVLPTPFGLTLHLSRIHGIKPEKKVN